MDQILNPSQVLFISKEIMSSLNIVINKNNHVTLSDYIKKVAFYL
jgi:hypothetical protein